MREAKLERKTKETAISIEVNLDKNENSKINTGIGFLDHMLELFSFHSNIGLKINCEGDLKVDGHHTTEDIGICLGKVLNEALGDKKGINRYGDSYLPMDETLVHCSLDISGRPYLVFNAEMPSSKVGDFETELTEEFFRAIAVNCGITLHLNLEYGKNTHHIIEAMFKSFGKAFKKAIFISEENKNKILSSKGVLD